MSVMASPSEQKIDIAASVRAAYTIVMDNARLAVDLAWLPFAILVGAEIVAWLVGGGGWFGMILALLVRAGGSRCSARCLSCAGIALFCSGRRPTRP